MGKGTWVCATDLHGEIVGSEREVVPTNKTRVFRSHVHLQVLEEVNILSCMCVLRGRTSGYRCWKKSISCDVCVLRGRTSGYSSRHLQNEPCSFTWP